MVFSRENIQSLCLQDCVLFLDCVIHSYLVGALTHLPLPIEHEAPSECVDLIIIRARAVALSALNILDLVIRNIFPFGLGFFDVLRFQSSYPEHGNLLIGIVIQASKQIGPMVNGGEGGALSGGGAPAIVGHLDNRYVKTFSLLHPLHVRLQPPRKSLHQLVPGDVVGGLSDEKLRAIIILVRAWIDHLDVLHHSVPIQFPFIQLFDSLFEVFLSIDRWSKVEVRNCTLVVDFLSFAIFLGGET
jgi:hypothetical protein